MPPSPIGNAQKSLSQERDRWFESGSLQRRVRVSSNLAIAALHNDHDGAVTFASPRSNRPLSALGSPVTTSVLLAAAVILAVVIHRAAAAWTGETAPSWLRGSNPLAADPVRFVKRLATASKGREAMSRADKISVSSKRFAA